jgi:hypothetical protein
MTLIGRIKKHSAVNEATNFVKKRPPRSVSSGIFPTRQISNGVSKHIKGEPDHAASPLFQEQNILTS